MEKRFTNSLDSSEGSDRGNITRVVYEKASEITISTSEEIPMQEWSSLIQSMLSVNEKKREQGLGLYSPGSGEICAKYIAVSDSEIYKHPYYNYPALEDPGINSALLKPIPSPLTDTDDGIELYKALCDEVNEMPVRLFYENLKYPEINLSYYCVSPVGVRIMATALKFNIYVRRLNLTDTYLDLDACYHLGQMIKFNGYLQELILNGCRMRESGLRQFGAELDVNVSLKTLNIAKNDLTDDGGKLFAKIIGDGASFSNVDLSYNKLGVQTLRALSTGLCRCNHLTNLNLSWNPCVPELCSDMVTFLHTLGATSAVLEELNLSWMQLGNARIAAAIASVMLVPTLKHLNLSNNCFTDNCASHLVANLIKATHLHTYNLSDNRFSPSGACVILHELQHPRVKLKNLYLDNICVNRNFMEILASIKRMKCRRKFVVTHDRVLHDWVAVGNDPRELVLKRGEFLGKSKKGNVIKIDVPMLLLSISYSADKLVAKEVLVMMKTLSKIQITEEWVKALIEAFPGPTVDKKPTVNTKLMREYIRRLWPDKKLPPDFKPPIVVKVDVKRKSKSAIDLEELKANEEKKKSVKKGSSRNLI